MKQNTKDWVQYGTAIAMIASAIALAFISFTLIMEVHTSVLVYISEALAYAAGIFGVSIYFNSKVRDINTRIRNIGSKPDEERKEEDTAKEEEQWNENEL